jgi:glutamine amidotransferase
LYKTTQPPLNDLNFRSICANTATKVAFAHIRMATATPVVVVNNHPFVFGRHTFMHNGEVSNFVEVRREICDLLDQDAFANIHGGTDSEHVAALYISILTKGQGKEAWEKETTPTEMKNALQTTVDTIIRLQKKKLGTKAIPNDLNMASTDGRHLIAFRIRNHPTEQPPSLYYSTTAGQTLNRKYPDHPDGGANPNASKKSEEHRKHVIVASEPTTYKTSEWTLVEKNHCLMVDSQGNVAVEAVSISF